MAPSFVDHLTSSDAPSDWQELTISLQSLHQTSPDAELIVDELTVVGDMAMSWLSVRRTAPTTFLGVPLSEAPVLWGRTDIIRVAQDRVIERWSDATPLLGLRTIGRGPIEQLVPAEMLLILERVVIDPGEVVLVLPSVRALFVESGSLQVDERDVEAPNQNEWSHRAVSSEDGILAFQASRHARLSNVSSDPVSALILRATLPELPQNIAPSSFSPAVTTDPWGRHVLVQRLAGSTFSTSSPEGAVTMAVGEMTLMPGTAGPAMSTTGLIFAWVESGETTFSVSNGSAWIESRANSWNYGAKEGALAPEDGMFVGNAGDITLRASNDASARLLLVVIAPTA
jgi:hypothetical protein